jgi:hypothetical protein
MVKQEAKPCIASNQRFWMIERPRGIWGSGSIVTDRTSHVVGFTLKSWLRLWWGSVFTFLIRRLTSWSLRWKSWFGLGGISITVLDRTSYIVEFTLKVLAWSWFRLGWGSVFTFLIRRLRSWSLRWRSWVVLEWGSILTFLKRRRTMWRYVEGLVGCGSVSRVLIKRLGHGV